MTQTPGPWRIDFDGNISTEPTEDDKYSRLICSLPWGSFKEFNQEPNKANARLIAAAPELLEAAEAAVAALTQRTTTPADVNAAKTWLDAAIARTK